MEYFTTVLPEFKTAHEPSVQEHASLRILVGPFVTIHSLQITTPSKFAEGTVFQVVIGSHASLEHPVHIVFPSDVHTNVFLGAFTKTLRPTVLIAPTTTHFGSTFGTESSGELVTSVGNIVPGNDVRSMWEWRASLDIPTTVVREAVCNHLKGDTPTLYALAKSPEYIDRIVQSMAPTEAETMLDKCLGKFITTPSDINEHLETLMDLASECDVVLELGTRGGVSFMAFLGALVGSKPVRDNLYFPPNLCTDAHRPLEEYYREWDALVERSSASALPVGDKRLIGVDLEDYSKDLGISTTLNVAKILGVDASFVKANDLEYDPPEVDLCFIDTLHCFTQLRDELERYAPKVRKYIVMHDTTVDGTESEFVRLGSAYETDGFLTIDALCKANPHWTKEDCLKGLWFAVEDFLKTHSDEWALKFRHTHNNGLTCLERIKGSSL